MNARFCFRDKEGRGIEGFGIVFVGYLRGVLIEDNLDVDFFVREGGWDSFSKVD